MRVNTFAWLTLITAAAVGGVEACSSDPVLQNSSGTTGAGGGATGTTSGETASASVTSTSAASTTSVSSSVASSSSTGVVGLMCGASSCADADLAGVITLSACCPDKAPPDKCGLDLTPVQSFIGVALGCVELNQPGGPDKGCPDQMIAAMGQMVTLPGCCRPDMLCGNTVDFTMFAPGLDFGCVNGATFMDGGAPSACGGGTSSSSGGSSSASSGSSGSGSASGSSSSTGP